MAEKLKHHEGNYRFLIPSEENGLVVGTPTELEDPNHTDIAIEMGLDPKAVRGGYVEIWMQGDKMAFCGGAVSVPEATEEEFNAARERGIIIFEREG